MEINEENDSFEGEQFEVFPEEIDTTRDSQNVMVVPWLSWDEWIFVKESLFSSSPNLVDTALKRISAWQSRGCLPDAIEVTASIIEIRQKDPYYRGPASNAASDSEKSLAMLYCFAIMRLLNDFVEKPRNKTYNKARSKKNLSIADAASQMGIPRLLVDIRHEASHSDLPSLKLGRLGSEEALDWLKSYYWEPQKNAINFKEEIKSKLQELEYLLSIKKAQPADSSSKRRCTKQSALPCGRNKFYTYMTVKHQAGKSGGSKKKISKTIKALVRLYSSYPSEVASALLRFLLKSSNFSYINEVGLSANSQVELGQGNMHIQRGSPDSWKHVITMLAIKISELWIMILKEVLEMIETREITKSATGEELLPTQSSSESQIQHLSSLAIWLIKTYKKSKHQNHIGNADESIPDSSAEADTYPGVTLKELLRKCLLVLSAGNKQLSGCATLLAEMVGNDVMTERLKKLALLNVPDLNSFVHESVKVIFQQQKASISEAKKKLEFLMKLRRPNKVDTTKKKNTWNLANSWNPCPLGMLPSAIGSKGNLPILRKPIETPVFLNTSENMEGLEMNCCNCNKENSTLSVGLLEELSAVNLLEDSTAVQETKIQQVVESRDYDQSMSLEPFEGHLLIDGVWKKVTGDELSGIEAAVGILV